MPRCPSLPSPRLSHGPNPRAGRASLSIAGAACLLTALAAWVLVPSVPAGANPAAISAAEAEQLYRELSSRRGSLADASDQLSKISRLAMPSVVHIECSYAGPKGQVEETGSGIVIRSGQRAGLFVVTNRHVVDGASNRDIDLRLNDGRELHPVRLWTDRATDLAVLELPVNDVPAARWANSDEARIGHMVLAMGSPFGLSQSVTYGIISAKGRRSLSLGEKSEVLNQNFLQTDAAINPGNSGGPLIDLQGRVVGINTAIASSSGGNEGIAFAVPSNLVRQVADQLISSGRVRRAYLGVKLDPKFDLRSARQVGLQRLYGARVLLVYEGTPAAKAGLQIDDVILALEGREIADENDLINRVSLMPIGSRTTVDVLRSGRKIRLQVVLADRQRLQQRSELPNQRPLQVPVRKMSETKTTLATGAELGSLLKAVR